VNFDNSLHCVNLDSANLLHLPHGTQMCVCVCVCVGGGGGGGGGVASNSPPYGRLST